MSNEAAKLISNIKDYILNPIIGFMFAVAVVMFIYGIVEWIWDGDNEEKGGSRKEAYDLGNHRDFRDDRSLRHLEYSFRFLV